jgi:quercetin dioxygenase-like cupin family protein
MTERVCLYRWDELPLEAVTELIARKVIAGARERLAQVYLKRGALVPVHAHTGTELIYVLEGALSARVGGEVVTARDGDVLRVPAGMPHQLEALDDTFVLDVKTEEA